MPITISQPIITWEKLPPDFYIPDDPVDNFNQPPLAAALTESLEIAGRISPLALIGTNCGIGATVDGKVVIKAPDWFYVRSVRPPNLPNQTRRSYTPHTEGEVPIIAIEFLSDTEGGEYSIKSKYPPGKWYYYEQILQIPTYAIFDPDRGWLEVYQLNSQGKYQQASPADTNGRYPIPGMGLSLGVWQGEKANRSGYWLRWWDEAGLMLLWGTECLQQERELRSRLAAKLRELGVNPSEL